ncbi:hypothetical protein [Adhaeribacter terreus]|uniref:Uncharacterized protein n=1 Tax=Adhaeribacter terreus TaxID=529703 RepID=A0ABW0E8H0_9BACT
MKFNKNESGERGHRNHLEGEGTKADRQGGGPGERSSMAGEQGAKAENPNDSIRSHTQAGEVHGAGTLKEGSSRDQANEDRFGLHLGDDYRKDRITGEQNEDVRRQTGTANHAGGKTDGSGGGKSSGGAGHGPQSHTHAPDSSGSNNPSSRASSNEGSGGTNVNTKDYKGYEGGTPPGKLKSGGDHQHGGEFPPRTRQNPNEEGSSAGSH